MHGILPCYISRRTHKNILEIIFPEEDGYNLLKLIANFYTIKIKHLNLKGLWASTLVGLIRESPVLDPLAVQHLNN